METLDNYRFEIPVAALRSPAEVLQQDVIALHAIEDPKQRDDQSQELFIGLRLKDGTSVMDTIFSAMDDLERPSGQVRAEAQAQAQAVIESLTRVIVKGRPGEFPLTPKTKPVDGIQLEITPGGDLADVSYVRRVPIDRAATARNMRMSRRAPSGPAGGLVHIANATPGQHIR